MHRLCTTTMIYRTVIVLPCTEEMHHVRVLAPVDDTTLEKIDEAAKEKGISRAQWVSSAIESVLHREEDDVERLRRERKHARKARRSKANPGFGPLRGSCKQRSYRY